MKAKAIISKEEFADRVTQAAITRLILIDLLIHRKEYKFGKARINRHFDLISKYAEHYLPFVKGGVGDEVLFRELEREGIEFDERIKQSMLAAERSAFSVQIK